MTDVTPKTEAQSSPMRPARRKRGSGLLLLLNLLLMGAIFGVWKLNLLVLTPDQVQVSLPGDLLASSALEKGSAFPPESAFEAVYDKALFLPGRLSVPHRAGASLEEANPDAPQLLGVVLSGKERFAIARTHDGTLAHLVEKQDIDGWTVEDIRKDSVVFSHSGQKTTVTLPIRAPTD